MKHFLIIFFTLFFLLGCTQEKIKPLNQLHLQESGITSLNAKTLFHTNIIASKLLGYDVVLFSRFEHTKIKKLIIVSYKSQEILYIHPTLPYEEMQSTIAKIEIVSDLVTNPKMLKLGADLSDTQLRTCQNILDQIHCKEPHITYIFDKEKKLLSVEWSADA